MRGKAILSLTIYKMIGITPAHAGKSLVPSDEMSKAWDHPRACGEKVFKKKYLTAYIGSPPRMRGKVAIFFHCLLWIRITPAHAGKRRANAPRVFFKKDHPRACGEKFLHCIPQYLLSGSPPRMRGKVAFLFTRFKYRRITPAHAGKSGSRISAPFFG